MSVPAHAVVLLAAGGSRRLGKPKQLVVLDGEPLVRRAALAALATAPAESLIVVGGHAEAVWGAVADLALTRVDCASWAEGLSASIRAGLRSLAAAVDGVLFVLCDQPALDACHLQTLVERWCSDPQRAVASSYSGTLGVPAVLPAAWLKDPDSLTGDRGARDLLRARSGEVVAVPAAALADDVDVPADLGNMRVTRSPTWQD